MRVIGTAGHVDHGKSTLVQRLTNIDPDRLAEEKARQLTIDLGFAWLDLPRHGTVGIVDVPGHRDFIENMLAGIGGIDAALLVVAADEGVMPQTREHLAILDLLDIRRGLIVITKIDLVPDPEWLDLVETDILEAVQDTVLQDAPRIRVSAHRGQGIDTLVEQLTAILDDIPPPADYRQPRLPIDRVFTVEGFGTVVTGTLTGGALHIGDEILIQPTGLRGRIRGLQRYQQPVEIAAPGSRVAVNISGVSRGQIQRGQVLTYPGLLSPTQLVDVHFQHLPDASRPLKHNTELKFFSGTAETIAHARLLGDEQLAPGEDGWLQLRLRAPLPLTRGDRFILRRPSPPQTIGGGIIVNPSPARRWKRFRPEVLQELATRLRGSPAERVEQAAAAPEPVSWTQLQHTTNYEDQELNQAVDTAVKENRIVVLHDGRYWAASRCQQISSQIREELARYHRVHPLRQGMPREELRSRLKIQNTVLNLLLAADEHVQTQADVVYLHNHRIQFDAAQQAAIQSLLEQMRAAPYMPPSYEEASEITGEEVLHALIDLGEIVQVQPGIIFHRPAYEDMVGAIQQLIAEHGDISAREVRDHFGSSRKYAIGLLEHLDALGITRRVGDRRVSGPRAS